jgi:transposase
MFILVILVNISAFEAPAEAYKLFDTMAKCKIEESRVSIYKKHIKIKTNCTQVA